MRQNAEAPSRGTSGREPKFIALLSRAAVAAGVDGIFC